MNLENLVTAAQFAKMFGISRPTVYKYVREKRLKTIQVGGHKFIILDLAHKEKLNTEKS